MTSPEQRAPARWSAVAALLLAVALVAGACSNGTGAGAGSTSTTRVAPVPAAPAPPAIVWSTCPASASIQCGTVPVPLDYRHPDGPSISLAVTRSPSLDPADPNGTLVVNPGGPGESGNQILPVVLSLLPAAVRRGFDVVSFDPRGTGTSDPLRCGTSPSVLESADPVPAGPGLPLPGTPAFTAMARACAVRAPQLAPLVDTTDTARDMDRVRQALGLRTISYYGMSYGTVLGSVYADLFPHRVATMVLDGAVDVNASLSVQANEQAPAAERSLDHLFAQCAATAGCPLGTDPTRTFDMLATALRSHPLPAPGNGDPVPVTEGDLDTATLFALSVTDATASYESAVAAAVGGNGAPLRALSLEFGTDLDGSSLVDALWAITCNDAPMHPGPVAAGTLARSIRTREPLIGAYAVTYAMGGCVSWPTGRRPVEDLRPAAAPPVLVIGNTGDPNTPLVAAQHLTAIFPSATQVTWRGWGHTWLLSGSSDTCMQGLVARYLAGGGLPPRGTTCA